MNYRLPGHTDTTVENYIGTWSRDAIVNPSLSAIDVVNRRMDAYNAHDMDAFLATYSHDVVIYGYPDTLLGQGHEHLQRIFADLFRTKSNRVEIKTQIERQEHVINDERVTYGALSVRYVSIYEVRDGLITSVRFVGRD